MQSNAAITVLDVSHAFMVRLANKLILRCHQLSS
jgi:hypothetical protein